MRIRTLLNLYRWSRRDGRSRVDAHADAVESWLASPSLTGWCVLRLLATGALSMALRHFLEITRSRAQLVALLLWAACMAIGASRAWWGKPRQGEGRLSWWSALRRLVNGPPGLGDAVFALLLGAILISPERVVPVLRRGLAVLVSVLGLQ